MITQKYLKLLFLGICLAASVRLDAQVTYRLSGTNSVRISGTSTLSDWVVKSQEVSGEMIFLPSQKAGKGFQSGVIKNANAVLGVSTIKSEKGETMDNKMYKALKSESQPRITFVLTKPIPVSKAVEKISATGNMEIAGVTKAMTFDLTVVYTDNNFHLEGTRMLKFSDFEIEPPTAMFGQIVTGDEITVKMELSFTRAAGN